MENNHNYCLILAGGNGSRLWPVSRSTRPKQFMDLLGTGRTMLQQTFDSVARFIRPDHIYVSTNVEYLPLVYEQLPMVDDLHILEEPVRRGTLASTAWGTVVIAKEDPEARVLVTPADQLIVDETAFAEDMLNALRFVGRHDMLVTTGVRPTRPDTGYGYIQLDNPVEGCRDMYRVTSFTEKPSIEFARIFMEEGDFLWNTGLLCFSVRVMLDNLYMLVPEYQLEIPRMMAEAECGDPKLVPEFFSSLPNLNVDVSILERSDNVCVLAGHFGWADVGTWQGLYCDAPADENGNVLLNTKAYLYECANNIIRLPSGRTAVVKGLTDYVVAEEGEILMITPRSDAAAMRRMHTDTKFG